MYCPKCGQPQISDEARFCSRCGFQLGIVAELLPTDGVLQNYQSPSENLSLYRRITSQVGAKLIFLSVVLVPVAVLIGLAFDTPAFLIPLLILFLTGLIQILYVQIFGKKDWFAMRPGETKNLNAADAKLNLPAPQTAPVPLLEIRSLDTNEIIAPPPSVTDHTTKLLELNADSDELVKTRR